MRCVSTPRAAATWDQRPGPVLIGKHPAAATTIYSLSTWATARTPMQLSQQVKDMCISLQHGSGVRSKGRSAVSSTGSPATIPTTSPSPIGTVTFSIGLLECLASAGQLAAVDCMSIRNAHLLMAICRHASGQQLRERLADKNISLGTLEQVLRAGIYQAPADAQQDLVESRVFPRVRPDIQSSKELVSIVTDAVNWAAWQGTDVVSPQHVLECMTHHTTSLDVTRAPLAFALHHLLPSGSPSEEAQALCKQQPLTSAATESAKDTPQQQCKEQAGQQAGGFGSPAAEKPTAATPPVLPQHILPLQTLPMLDKAAASIRTVKDAAELLATFEVLHVAPNAALQQHFWSMLQEEDAVQQVSALNHGQLQQVLRMFSEYVVPAQHNWTDVLQMALLCLLRCQDFLAAKSKSMPSTVTYTYLRYNNGCSDVDVLHVLRSLVAMGFPHGNVQLQVDSRGHFHDGPHAFLKALLVGLQEDERAFSMLVAQAQSTQPVQEVLEAYKLLRQLGNTAVCQPHNVLLLAQQLFERDQASGRGRLSAADKAAALHDLMAAAAPIPAGDISAWATLCLDSSPAVKQAMVPTTWGSLLAAGTKDLSTAHKLQLLCWAGSAGILGMFQIPAVLNSYLAFLNSCITTSGSIASSSGSGGSGTAVTQLPQQQLLVRRQLRLLQLMAASMAPG